jgi:recombination protein RecA
MAKKKITRDENMIDMDDGCLSIAKETGGDVLADLDPIKGYIDTGNLAYNFACSGRFIGGGIPRGRITEIYGPSSSGKSLVGSNIMHGCQKMGGWAVLMDVEDAANVHFMENVSGIDLKKLIRFGPDKVETLEKCFLMVHNVTRKIRSYEQQKGFNPRPIVIVYDSIAGSPCERELKETNLPFDFTPGDWKKIVGRNEQPGERGKICSRELRKLVPAVAANDVSFVILNQVRDKIGLAWGNPETTAGGGRSLEFYASLRVRMQANKKIENKKFETFAGINLTAKNIKNRSFRPFITASDIKLYFEQGVDPLSGVLLCLFQSERITVKSAGRWDVAKEYLPEGQEEYSFQASKVKNTVPKQVFLDCPKLIDANSREEVEQYLSQFSKGLEASESGTFGEKAVSFEEDGNPVESDVEESEE